MNIKVSNSISILKNSRGVDFLNFVKNDQFDDAAQKKNIEEFNKAIDFVKTKVK